MSKEAMIEGHLSCLFYAANQQDFCSNDETIRKNGDVFLQAKLADRNQRILLSRGEEST